MELTSILSTIREIWAFIWPPIIELAILVSIFRFIAPDLRKRIGIFLTHHLETQKRAIAYIRLLGARKFMGVIFVFSLLFMLYVSQQLLYDIGSLVPGEFVTVPAAEWASLEKYNLPCLLAQFPNSEIFQLEGSIEQRWRAVADERLLTRQYWSEQLRTTYREITNLKGLFVLVLLLAVGEGLSTKSYFRLSVRFLVVLCVLTVASGYLVIKWVSGEEMRIHTLRYEADQIAVEDHFRCEQLAPSVIAQAELRALPDQYIIDKRARWWTISFIDTQYFKRVGRSLGYFEEPPIYQEKVQVGQDVTRAVLDPKQDATAKDRLRRQSAVFHSNMRAIETLLDSSIGLGYLPLPQGSRELRVGDMFYAATADLPMITFFAASQSVLDNPTLTIYLKNVDLGRRIDSQSCKSIELLTMDRSATHWSFRPGIRLHGELLIVTDRLDCVQVPESNRIILGVRVARIMSD